MEEDGRGNQTLEYEVADERQGPMALLFIITTLSIFLLVQSSDAVLLTKVIHMLIICNRQNCLFGWL